LADASQRCRHERFRIRARREVFAAPLAVGSGLQNFENVCAMIEGISDPARRRHLGLSEILLRLRDLI
jgi:hypothetical protein